MVILWTDLLLWIMLIAGVFVAKQCHKRVNVREKWQAVFANPLAICAFVVMMSYLFVGLLDSVHFKHQSERNQGVHVVSLLDKVTGFLGARMEQSYSEPLALMPFALSMSADTLDVSSPEKAQRLKYVDVDLKGVADRDTLVRTALLYSFLLGIGGFFAVRFWMHWRKNRRHRSNNAISEKTALAWQGSFAFLLFVGFLFFSLSSSLHVLGTDQIGMDIFYKVLKSIRTALIIGSVTTLLILPFAMLLGCASGYFGGWVDDVVQYLYTTISAIPGVLLIAAMILSLQIHMAAHPDAFGSMLEQADIRLLFLCAILGLTSWTGLCRMLRGETLKLREMEFVLSARALGSSSFRIIVKHIFPNIMHLVLITVVLDFSVLILSEAVLSYIGVGVDPHTMSWGTMINSARLELAREPVVWWPLLSAFVSMLGLVLAVNLFAEAVRDAFDPRSGAAKRQG